MPGAETKQVVVANGAVVMALSAALKLPYCPADVGFAVTKNGMLRGGILFNRFARSSIACHMVGFTKTWITPDLLYVGFHYPFGQLMVDRIFGFVNSSNIQSMSLAKKLGFRVETVIGKVYPDGDQVVLVMEKSECRWLKMKPRRARHHGIVQSGRTGPAGL